MEQTRPRFDLGVAILSKSGDEYELVEFHEPKTSRQVQVFTELAAGEYYIVPVTAGCKLSAPHDRTFKKPDLIINREGVKDVHPIYYSIFHDIFRKLDGNGKLVLDADDIVSLRSIS